MKTACNERPPILRRTVLLLVCSTLVGALTGTASALFLFTLAWATKTREAHPGLIWFLPLAGAGIGWLYHRFGREIEGGNNLLIDEIHTPKNHIPLRLAPMILLTTVLTHLFGGSAGREGTAIQMGGALADQLDHSLKSNLSLEKVRRTFSLSREVFLLAGMSGGFASVFGVPWAGMVFGLEVVAFRRFAWDSVLSCVVAAFVGHWVCLSWGAQHTHYPSVPALELSLGSGGWVLLSGVAFGLYALFFSHAIHQIGAYLKTWIRFAPLRPFLGGVTLLAIYFILDHFTGGFQRYTGLGIEVIEESMRQPLVHLDFLWKTVTTLFTLGSSFKGGEVTPLLYIGSALGNALAAWIPLPISLLAAMGFVAVFAGAANTPLACTLMGIEIFGFGGNGSVAVCFALACGMSFFCSGPKGIYRAQRGSWKYGRRRSLKPRS